MLRGGRNFGLKTTKKPASLTRFLLPAEPLCFSLHRGLLPQPPPPLVCPPPYPPTQIFIRGRSTTATVTIISLCRFLLLSSSSCSNHHLPLQQHHHHHQPPSTQLPERLHSRPFSSFHLYFPVSFHCMQNVHRAHFCNARQNNYPGWIMVTMHGTVTSPGWIISPVHAAGLSPTQYKIVIFYSGRSQPNFVSGPPLQTFTKKKYIFKNIHDFLAYFSIHFN